MRLQQTVNSPTQSRIILPKQGRDGGTIKGELMPSSLRQQLIMLHLFFHLLPVIFTFPLLPSDSLSSLLSLSSLPDSPPRFFFLPTIYPSLPPHLSTVVALVTIQRDFLHSSVTVATLGFPPGCCWKCTSFRSTPGGLY